MADKKKQTEDRERRKEASGQSPKNMPQETQNEKKQKARKPSKD